VFESVVGAGPSPKLVITDSADPKLTRSFDNLAALVEETRVVRIWGGIHFRSALEASDAVGRQIASYIVANSMRPVR